MISFHLGYKAYLIANYSYGRKNEDDMDTYFAEILYHSSYYQFANNHK